MTSYFRLHP